MKEYDLIIVGAGTAGLPCAITAAENGANVLMIEKDSQIGGTLHSTGGHMSAGGTKQQKLKGIQDNPALHYADVIRICRNTADRDLVKLACDEAPKTIDWLDDLGFDFAPESPRIVYGHAPYQIARTHYGKDAGKSILNALLPLWNKYVKEGKIEIHLEYKLINLIKKEDKFVGIIALHKGIEKIFNAKNIVLTTGGYAANSVFFAKVHPDRPRLISTADLNSQGEGIEVAQKFGAAFRWAEKHISSLGGVELEPQSGRSSFWDSWAMVFTTMYRPAREIYVNEDGKRFMNENEADPDIRERTVAQQKGERFWAIFDENSLMAKDEKGNEKDQLIIRWNAAKIKAEAEKGKAIFKANTIEELAKRIGINSENFKQTISDFNKIVRKEFPDTLDSSIPYPIEKAPFYAILSYTASLISFGGLTVNKSLQILDQNGKVMQGLYAAGEILGAAATTGNAFCGGMLITPAISFGRILGKKLAKEAKL